MLKKAFSIILVFALLSVSLSGCAVSYEKYTMSFYDTFDTVITIIGFAPSQAIFDEETKAAHDLFLRLHRLYDQYTPYPGINNVYRLNSEAANAPVKVEKELFELLAYCKDMQPMTEGTVNIAMGAVLSIWHDYRDAADYDPANAQLPPMDRLQAAAGHTDISDMILDQENMTVFFADPLLKLDVGAVAKGYAAGLVGDYLKQSRMPSFILSAGGNIVAGDAPLDGRLRWGVSVQDPDQAVYGAGELMDVLYFANRCAVTSGDYQRYYVVDGVKYHHIISPDTLYPATNMRAVTVVAEDSALSDLLSTALFLMEPEKAIAFAEALDGVDALVVRNDRSLLMTDGMANYAKSLGATSK